MAITNYTELQAAVKNWLHRGSSLDSRIAELIALGEAYLNRVIRAPDMETSSSVTANTSNRYVALPSGFLDFVTMVDPYGDEVTHLDARTVAAASVTASSGLPASCAITSRIEFDRVPDQTYSYLLIYLKRLDIATDGTNWLLTSYPDAYLYSALMQAAPYLKNDQRIATLKDLLDASVFSVNGAEKGKRNAVLRCDDMASSRFDIARGY